MKQIVTTEAATRADFTSIIRYAQCWEDADILLQGLDVQAGDICVSIASAGENSLSLLTRGPGRVIAIDLNPAQLACVSLRMGAYRRLDHSGLLALLGSTEATATERMELYRSCRDTLPREAVDFWDARPELIGAGVGTVGKFERYFRVFRRWVLPWVHGRRRVAALLQQREPQHRRAFYASQWDTWRWRGMFALFFSRIVLGRLGRDPAFFKYVEGNVAERILSRGRHALTELDPSTNPYLRWILEERHVPEALPHALRPENFNPIRDNLDRLELRQAAIEEVLSSLPRRSVHRFNLSDIFEYMSEENYRSLLTRIAEAGAPTGRIAYWNMLVPRSRPDSLANQLHPLTELSEQLHRQDKAFFYSRFVVEEVQ